MTRDEFNEKCEIRITITIDVGDERVVNEWETIGSAADISGTVDDAIADLGRLERSTLPASVEEQYQSEIEEEED
jgi:hypothetical protein